ncbi:MgtC/SapB family protein [Paludibacter jiangxiensis]|uniref:Putative Mg2+ transporter-C MgtC family protein n=1 Tax=Paludibacter jiangxiensis TaxID=681398 RepID=A0A161LUP5_9BACT|nr:MgtC/SapB family protein [Paludibacter jiangxiensis]GAT62769.1 putative Mg2+ transporter-C MgtC family protein [Paludibacter jiangxiensis]
MQLDYVPYVQILAAFAAGATLGLEREYHNKPAGFRTMILITVSSCLFTILSVSWTGDDRIASNIVTGIGFIGAGVVFKEGANVKGITSAAIIWMAAAIGMCIGLQHYVLAAMVVVLVMLVLLALFKFETAFDNLHQMKSYEIRFVAEEYSIDELEREFTSMHIKFLRTKTSKQMGIVSVEYNIEIHPGKRDQFESFLIRNSHISSFES